MYALDELNFMSGVGPNVERQQRLRIILPDAVVV
jgi:hypothetical protein